MNKKKSIFPKKIPFFTEICIYIWLKCIIYTIIYKYKY